MSAELVLDEGYTFKDVYDGLITSIKAYFNSQNKVWANNTNLTLRTAQVITAILNVKGVIDVTRCLLNGGTANIELKPDEILNLSGVKEL